MATASEYMPIADETVRYRIYFSSLYKFLL